MKKQLSRNLIEIIFSLGILREEDEIIPRKWHLEAVIQSCFEKKMFMSTKSLKKSTAPESFLNNVSGWRFVPYLKRDSGASVYSVNVEELFKYIIYDKKRRQILEIKQQ